MFPATDIQNRRRGFAGLLTVLLFAALTLLPFTGAESPAGPGTQVVATGAAIGHHHDSNDHGPAHDTVCGALHGTSCTMAGTLVPTSMAVAMIRCSAPTGRPLDDDQVRGLALAPDDRPPRITS
jgi:hypothetical protein